MSSAPPAAGGEELDLEGLARCLWMEAAAGAAWAQLAAQGIPAVLLKGAAIAHWLYRDDEVRLSRDVDLLVPPGSFAAAQQALARLGYQTQLAGAPACEVGPNSVMLLGNNRVWIDLHHRLIGVPDPPGRCWTVLSCHTVDLVVAGVAVKVLDLPARTAHLALHVAQGGREDTRAMADLERGLDRLAAEEWRAAAAVARELGAVAAFVAGLSLCPAGVALIERLDLPRERTLELELRTMGAPSESLFFVRLAATPGRRAKAALIARKFWPTPAFMQANYRLAGRTPFGAGAARLWRPLQLIARAGPALVKWRQARLRLRGTGTAPQ